MAQHKNEINATLNDSTKQIEIQQKFTYVNDSEDGLSILYFNDWNHAYANRNTALAKRFGEEFKRSLHLGKDSEKGDTHIVSIVDSDYIGLDWNRVKNKDIIRIKLEKVLEPGESAELFFTYTIKLPHKKFTQYGYNDNGEYYLKDWYLVPSVYDEEWKLYDNMNLDDTYTDVANTSIDFSYPEELSLASNFDEFSPNTYLGAQHIILRGTNRKNCEIILSRQKRFTKHVTRFLTVTTDLSTNKYDDISQGISIDKIAKFLDANLGRYPHGNLLVSQINYNKTPLYGINQLPSFIRPYKEQFQFEMKFLKTAINSFLEETLFLDPRAERWVNDAIANYLIIRYVEDNYPDQKLAGKLSKLWGFRSFHLAKMDFNEQYALLSMFAARKNIDQALSTPNDSLIKFNAKIANSYKAGLGMYYLSDYLGNKKVDSSIISFYKTHNLRPKVKATDFRNEIEKFSDKKIDWFFDEYVATRKKIDFKIKKIDKTEDSITFIIKNKRGTKVPISLFGLQKDSVVSKYWFSDIDTSRTFTIPRKGEDKLVLNYDQKIPEFNQRDNWKTLSGFFSSNKKLKFQFFKDTEDPYFNQVFYVPIANFNVYDGITPGMRIYNKTFLERPFQYDFAPTYSFLEKTVVGKASLRYRKYHGKSGLFVSNYSFSGSTSHFQVNSRFTTLTPAISFGWRPENLISNRRQSLLFRYRSVFRNIDEAIVDQIDTEPDYSVFNVRFRDTDNDILNFSSWYLDGQHSSDFTKLSFEMEYRKLYENNRQFNVRFYAGKFLRNRTDSDFFSFALDRPTDYLFDLAYLGRSEDSGIYSQQIIIAEGGFKSQLENPFANDWIATTNASTSIWRWIEVYGDLGFIRNKGQDPRFVYDSGVRLNLVTDFFELYFPVYSNRGWEIAEQNYGERIRFIVTLSPRTLTGLFTRKWF
ncbi:metalloprotease [Flagellimonas sp. HMM57]|uniref:metalloprotease n=1 Tax=unclassified Flagellimonas TaxID=2644544 RepID=UPI001F0AC337|nr:MULTISPECIES: metalloprotease [unclassified Flagellimonas]UII75719.1 metalloprotease [Flagellimonas sp. HMM57]